MPTKLSWFSATQVHDYLNGFKIFPDYLDCERFSNFSMCYDQVIVDYESGANNVLVVASPNFPSAGKGLISDRVQAMVPGNEIPYWGELFVHKFEESNIMNLKMKKKFAERLVELPVQPFLGVGICLYVLGSLSCVATYSNDAQFNGWGKPPKENSRLENNCHLWCYELEKMESFEALVNWLKKCPLWLVVNKKIKYGEEMLTKYFD